MGSHPMNLTIRFLLEVSALLVIWMEFLHPTGFPGCTRYPMKAAIASK
jgi:hypothetical protein